MSLQPIQITMEEMTDPEELAKLQIQWAQAKRNSEWLQTHATEIYRNCRGKFIVVAGEELFVGNTAEEADTLAEATHPEDKGNLGRYIYPKKMIRIYGHQW